MRYLVLALLISFVFLVQPALAHPGHGGHGFIDGWQHPLTGVDHLLAMIAVGLLAVRIGGRAIWIMPAMFMGGMVLGGYGAVLGIPLPGVEQVIMASVLVLGLLIAVTKVVPLSAGAALVALFAVFHGHAHAAEMPEGSTLAAYAGGFLLATALLHAAGVLGGLTLARWLNSSAVRVTGGLIATAGALMFCGVL